MSTSHPAYDIPSSSTFPTGGGPGEGDVLMGWTLRPLGAAFVMGGCTSISPQNHSLMLGMRHPPSVLVVPWPIPPQLISPPGSHFPPAPLDGDGQEQAECEHWDFSKAHDWMLSQSKLHSTAIGSPLDTPPFPIAISISRTQGLPTLHTLLTSDGRVYAMYLTSQVALQQSKVRSFRMTSHNHSFPSATI